MSADAASAGSPAAFLTCKASTWKLAKSSPILRCADSFILALQKMTSEYGLLDGLANSKKSLSLSGMTPDLLFSRRRINSLVCTSRHHS